MLNNILLLFFSLNSFASLDCANVDLNQLSDDKISEYTHCFKNAEVATTETPTTKSKLKYVPVCERSEPVKLKLEDIFNNSCEQITKDMLFAYDQSLDMAGEEYRKPKLGDFSGMSNLDELRIDNGNYETLPTGLFDDLENLKKLKLPHNKIEELPVKLFDKLLKLESLTLSFNNIKIVPIGAFDNLVNLRTLSLRGNHIEKVPLNLFDKLLKLVKLNLAQNRIKVLSKPLINNPKNSLSNLYLFGNPLTHIFNLAFKNLSQLTYLDLDDTNLYIFGKSVFEPLKALRTLRLAYIISYWSRLIKQPNEPTITLDEISLEQFTRQNPFPLKHVIIIGSEGLIRNQNFTDELKEKGVNVVD